MTNDQKIDKLLIKFYDASISQDEIDMLFNYFLYTNPLPECYSDDAELIQGLAIMRYCHKTKSSFEKSLIEKERKARNNFRYKTAKYAVMAAACVAALVIGLWKISPMIFMQPTADYNATNPVLVAQTTDIPTATPEVIHHKPSTITDNEIKNTEGQTMDKDTHTMLAKHNTATLPTTEAPQPDAIATTPIAQEPIPALLAEAETQTQAEQNFAIADTAINTTDTILQLQTDLPKYEITYLAYANEVNTSNHIPDISNINTDNNLYNIGMIAYCNTKCNSNDIMEIIFKGAKI